jgi:hypothetical protein
VRSLSSGKTKSDFDPRGPSALVSPAVLGIDPHPHDGTGYIGRLISSAAWVALSAGHADTAAIGRVGPLARAAPRAARMLLAHPAGIITDLDRCVMRMKVSVLVPTPHFFSTLIGSFFNISIAELSPERIVSDQVVEFFGMRLGRCMCAGDATSPQGGRRMSTMKKKPTRIDSGIWLICTSMILLMRANTAAVSPARLRLPSA